LHLPKDVISKIDFIQEHSHFENPTSAIRGALSAYDDLLKAFHGGYLIVIKDKTIGEILYSPLEPLSCPGLSHCDAANEVDISSKKPPKNLFFSEEVIKRLDSIKMLCYLHSNADIIRVALRACVDLISVITSGSKIVIRDSSERESNYDPRAPIMRGRYPLSQEALELSAIPPHGPSILPSDAYLPQVHP
jgi:hypothetical protein